MKTQPILKAELSFIGIDYHKRYSVFCVLDAQGMILERGRIDHLCPEQFVSLVRRWPGCRVVFEACMNWHWLLEILEEAMPREDIVLANPFKTRIIAEAQIKTDKVDARILADLLRANLIAKVHICGKATRELKEMLRQRCFFVRQRTMVRNRIHRLLGAQHELKLPQCSDLFGAKGLSFLEKLELPAPAGLLLTQQLALLEGTSRAHPMRMKRLLAGHDPGNAGAQLCAQPSRDGTNPRGGGRSARSTASSAFLPRRSSVDMPGCVPRRTAAEARLSRANCCRRCNKWLRWAFVEAAWVAVGCSPYFGDFYRRKRSVGKKANSAILATARLMGRITWQLLTQERDYASFPVEQELRCRPAGGSFSPVGPAKERKDFRTPKKLISSPQTFPSRSHTRLVGR